VKTWSLLLILLLLIATATLPSAASSDCSAGPFKAVLLTLEILDTKTGKSSVTVLFLEDPHVLDTGQFDHTIYRRGKVVKLEAYLAKGQQVSPGKAVDLKWYYTDGITRDGVVSWDFSWLIAPAKS
jgi:hypothetical protein